MEHCTPEICQQSIERPVLGGRQSLAGLDLVNDQHPIPSEKKYQPANAPPLDFQVGNRPLDISGPPETGDNCKSTSRRNPLGSRLSPATGEDAANNAARHQHSIEPSHRSQPRSALPDPIINANLPATSKPKDGTIASRFGEAGHVSKSCAPTPSLKAQGNGGNQTPRNCSAPFRVPAKAPDSRVSLPHSL